MIRVGEVRRPIPHTLSLVSLLLPRYFLSLGFLIDGDSGDFVRHGGHSERLFELGKYGGLSLAFFSCYLGFYFALFSLYGFASIAIAVAWCGRRSGLHGLERYGGLLLLCFIYCAFDFLSRVSRLFCLMRCGTVYRASERRFVCVERRRCVIAYYQICLMFYVYTVLFGDQIFLIVVRCGEGRALIVIYRLLVLSGFL